MSEQIEDEIESRFRADAADALVAASKVDVGGPLVEARTRELLRGVARQVEARGMPLETFLAMTGQRPRSSSPGSGRGGSASVARELVLEAVAEQARHRRAGRRGRGARPRTGRGVGDDADETLVELRESGRFETLRDDLRLRNALDHVAAEVKRDPARLRPRPARQSGRPTRRSPRPRRNSGPPAAKEPDMNTTRRISSSRPSSSRPRAASASSTSTRACSTSGSSSSARRSTTTSRTSSSPR